MIPDRPTWLATQDTSSQEIQSARPVIRSVGSSESSVIPDDFNSRQQGELSRLDALFADEWSDGEEDLPGTHNQVCLRFRTSLMKILDRSTCFCRNCQVEEPFMYEEAPTSPRSARWIAAMEKKLCNL